LRIENGNYFMKKSITLFALTAAGATFGAFAAPATGTGSSDGYLRTTRVDVVRSGSGLCWRLGYWTPAHAVTECDPELVPRTAAIPITPTPAQPPAPAITEHSPATPPLATPAPAPLQTVISTRALFDFDRSELRPGARQDLDKALADIRSKPVRRVRIEGHADRIGEAGYNQRLSERRAAAVRDYMVSQGFQADLIQITGYGSTRPVTDGCPTVRPFNQLVECLQPDRRVEVTTEPADAQAATNTIGTLPPAR